MKLSETGPVRIEFNDADYEALRTYASEHDLSVEEAVREAIAALTDSQRRVDPEDPAFAVLDELDAASDADSEADATDARREDDVVAEWSGDGVEFTLAEDP